MDLKMKGEKIGNLDPSKLHYMSLSFIEDVEFGKARLECALTDYWLDKKFEMPGLAFKADAPQLTQAEMDRVPGAAIASGAVDRLKLEVCAREGARIIIKPDEDRYWKAQGGTITEEYQALKDDHEKNYEKLLANIMQRRQGSSRSHTQGEEDGADPMPIQDDRNPTEALVEFENLDKLKETETIAEQVPSEIQDVEVIRCESGKLFLLAKKDKSLTKHLQIGGFGTGGYVATTDPGPGVKWNVTSDKSLVQVDDSTLRADAASVSVMTLYKLLVALEKTKRITTHKVSYLDVKRKEESEEELDGFEVTVRSPQIFKPMKNPSGKEEKASGKNVFSRCMDSLGSSPALVVCFRFRFEKIGGTLKVQKPYVVLSRAIQLTKDKPLQALFIPCHS